MFRSGADPGELIVGGGMMPSYFMASLYGPAETGGGGGGGGSVEAASLDRASLASKNHREAEKRRRERIKSHLDRLRAILACDPKTDKASLLAKAVEHVRDLKQRMAEISAAGLFFPAETDEIVVLPRSDGQRPVLEASVCCDDRSDLLPELIETLRSLRMKALRAEIATLGGRVRNVMVLAREKGQGTADEDDEDCNVGFLKEALVALVNNSRSSSPDRTKRRRVMDLEMATMA